MTPRDIDASAVDESAAAVEAMVRRLALEVARLAAHEIEGPLWHQHRDLHVTHDGFCCKKCGACTGHGLAALQHDQRCWVGRSFRSYARVFGTEMLTIELLRALPAEELPGCIFMEGQEKCLNCANTDRAYAAPVAPQVAPDAFDPVELVDRAMECHGCEPADSFGEPWSVFEGRAVFNAAGPLLVDAFPADLSAEEVARFLRRIVACVNICEGLPTDRLEAITITRVKQDSDLQKADAP